MLNWKSWEKSKHVCLTPPLQVEAEKLLKPNLDSKKENCGEARGLVKMSTSWKREQTYWGSTKPALYWSWTIWQSMSKCFVRSWKTGFAVMCNAAWLSHHKGMGEGSETQKSRSTYDVHKSSHTVEARLLYSASAEKRDTVDCFLVFQEMRAGPRNTQKPVRDRQVSCKKPSQHHNRPWAGDGWKRDKKDHEIDNPSGNKLHGEQQTNDGRRAYAWIDSIAELQTWCQDEWNWDRVGDQ